MNGSGTRGLGIGAVKLDLQNGFHPHPTTARPGNTIAIASCYLTMYQLDTQSASN